FRVVATRHAIIALQAANKNRVGTGARSDSLARRCVKLAGSPPVKIREGLMKSTLIRRNLFVFALAAALAASSLAGLRTASAAAPQQKSGAAAPSKPAPQRAAPAQAPAGPIAEAAPPVSRVRPDRPEVR